MSSVFVGTIKDCFPKFRNLSGNIECKDFSFEIPNINNEKLKYVLTITVQFGDIPEPKIIPILKNEEYYDEEIDYDLSKEVITGYKLIKPDLGSLIIHFNGLRYDYDLNNNQNISTFLSSDTNLEFSINVTEYEYIDEIFVVLTPLN